VSPWLTSTLVMLFTLGAALLGRRLGSLLPEHHLGDASKFIVKLTTGLIATLAALVLGLVTASAKSGFDAEQSSLQHMAADIITLDRLLDRYGPETDPIRVELRGLLESRIAMTWPADTSLPSTIDTPESTARAEAIEDQIRRLPPAGEDQRWLQAHALEISRDLLQTRWAFFAAEAPAVQPQFLAVLVLWLVILFGCFGLFAPSNLVSALAILLCSLSVSSAILLILELGTPFSGSIRLSDVPLSYALTRLGQ
jgi:hypothetical protein